MSSVIINLKEFFASDSPEMIAEKLNFDFNQLLLLGVGKKGDQGDQGPTGPIGPTGATGSQGIRGSYWFTGSLTTPPSASSLGAIPGDFYLNTQDAWQLDEDGTTWNPVLNFGTIINNYLSTSNSTFIRSINGVSNSEHFITFIRSDHQFNDRISTGYSPLSFKNDILFLHNYNISSLSLTPDDFYTAMQSIYVNHVNGNIDNTVRHHIQLGVFYDPGTGVVPTTENESYKIKYQIGNSGVFLARHVLAPIETAAPSEYNFDSSMNWVISKATTSGSLNLAFNSIQSMTSIGTLFDAIDGLSIENSSGSDISKWALGIDSNGLLLLQGRDGVNGYKLKIEGDTYMVTKTIGSGKTNIGRSTISEADPDNPVLGLNVLGSFGRNITYIVPDNTQVNSGNSYTLNYPVDDDNCEIVFIARQDDLMSAGYPYVEPSTRTGYPYTQNITFPAASASHVNRIITVKNMNYTGLWRLRLVFTTSGSSFAQVDPAYTQSENFIFGIKIQGQYPNRVTEYVMLPGESITFQCSKTGSTYAWLSVGQTIRNEPWKQVLENGHTYPTYIPSSQIHVNGQLVATLDSVWDDPSTLPAENVPLSMRKTFDNYVEFKGICRSNTTSIIGNVITVPVGYRPADSRVFQVYSGTDGAFVPCQVQANGAMWIPNIVSGSVYHFEFRYEAEQ